MHYLCGTIQIPYMPISLLPSLLLSILAVGYTPGPANIYSLSCALTHGRRKALKAWTGLLCGFCIAVIIAAAAAHFAGTALGEYVHWLKYIGAAYILYLAWKTFKASISTTQEVPCSFIQGMTVQLTNAKMILFDLTVFSSFVLPYSERFIDLLPVAALLLIAGPGGNLVWLLAGSVLRPMVEKHQRAVDIVMALALAACAAMIALR